MVYFHATGLHTFERSSFGYSNYLIVSLVAPAVPSFFMVNGYLLLNKPLVLSKHAWKTLRLYALTLAWSAICVLLSAFLLGNAYDVKDFVRTTLFLSELGVNNHLWFLFTLVAIYLFLPVLKPIYDRTDKTALFWLLAVCAFFSFGMTFFNWIATIANHVMRPGGGLRDYQIFGLQYVNPFGGRYYALIYFSAGGLLGQNFAKKYISPPTWALLAVFVASC